MGKREDNAMQDASPASPIAEKSQLSADIEAEGDQLGDDVKSINSASCEEEPGENQGFETEKPLSSAQEGQTVQDVVVGIVDGIVDAAVDDGSKSLSEPASTSDTAHDAPFCVDRTKETQKSQRDSSPEDSSSDSESDSEASEPESESGSISSEDTTGSNILPRGSNQMPSVPAEEVDNENLIEGSQGGGPILSKNEMDEDKLEIPRLEVSISENDAIIQLGEILSVMEKGVIVRSSTQSSGSSRPQNSTVEDIENASALNIGSVLCFSDRKPLGRVYDTFGPVCEPYYIVRYNSKEEVQNLAHTSPGTPIFFVQKHSHIVFGSQMKSKGYDTSNIHDEEVGAADEEFSDDEKERAAKNSRKRKKGSSDGESGRGKPSMVTQKRPRSRQNSARNPRRENFAQYRQEGHYGHNPPNRYSSTPLPPPVMQIGMQPMVMGAPGFPGMFPPQGQLAPMMQPTQMIPGLLNPQFPPPHTVNMMNSNIPMSQAQQPESHGFHASYGASPSPGGPWNGEPWTDSVMHNGIQQGQINPAALPRALPPKPPPQPPSQPWNRMC